MEDLLFCGVFDKFRALKVALVESTVGWIPAVREQTNDTFLRYRFMLGGERMKMLPSEYYDRNMWATYIVDTYDFFDQCPHRMACAKCAFYAPNDSGRAQILEGRANLLRMLQEIPLTEDERAAVDDGVAAFGHLLTKLADLPTPDGLTPRQLAGREAVPLRVVPTRTGEATR
jgi:hypothetical protein